MFVTKLSALSRFYQILILLLVVLAFYACAKTGSIYGGDKDETPPKVIKAKPPENSVNFIPQKKIILVFDEYIQLKDIFQELIISPPVDGRISAVLKGKSLVVEFPKEAVFDSTTYTISFGNAIADNNEGNVLENYKYIFSLKDYIDTMNVEGRIINAFNHQPDVDRMLVMLYKNHTDSAPMLELPNYISRSDKLGNFSINNIEPGHYRIFGLKDANLNMRYDLPNENIAFADSLIEITAEKFLENVRLQDSLSADSLQTLPGDSIRMDSAYTATLDLTESLVLGDTILPDTTGTDSIIFKNYYSFQTELFFFSRKIYNQYMTNYLRPRAELLSFTFNEAMADTFGIFPLNYTPSGEWFLMDASKDFDSLNFWITDTTMIGMDSLKMELCYPMYDSLGLLYEHPDTLLMLFKEEKKGTDRKTKDRGAVDKPGAVKENKSGLVIQNNIKKTNSFDLNKNIVLISETPVEHIIPDSIKLFRIQDTLELPVSHSVSIDTGSIYRIVVRYEPEEQTSYRLFTPDSTIRDIYGTMNDTIDFKFKTQQLSAYATLSLNISNVTSDLILQLMTEKEDVLIERIITADGNQRYEYLYPGKYILKIIVDKNQNRKWDTGDYLQKIQPEKVYYFNQTIELRSNWEMEFNWDVNFQGNKMPAQNQDGVKAAAPMESETP